MTSVPHRLDEHQSLLSYDFTIPTLFRPRLYDIPVVAKHLVLVGLGPPSIIQVSNFRQFAKIVLVASLGLFLVGEIVPSSLFGYAGFQRALYSVTG
jgi:hypothetical protein